MEEGTGATGGGLEHREKNLNCSSPPAFLPLTVGLTLGTLVTSLLSLWDKGSGAGPHC